MAYVQADVDSIKAAMLAMANGQREVAVRFSDGSSVTYENVQLASLERVLLYAQRDVAAATPFIPGVTPRPIKSFRVFPGSGYR